MEIASRSSWARGLKHAPVLAAIQAYESRSSWARGLKHQRRIERNAGIKVALLVGAWIETTPDFDKNKAEKSRSSWARGLKLAH